MKKVILFLGIFFILLTTVSSIVTISDYNISKDYFAGSTINGYMNISLDDESSLSIISDSEGTSLTLLDFLKKVNYNYTCIPNNCLNSYSEIKEISGNSINLGIGEEKIIGLKYTGALTDITNISFDIISDAGESINNQLKIDILNNGEYDTGNNKISEILGETKMGCYTYESKITAEEVELDNIIPYCQNITLEESPGLKIGAWLKESNKANIGINMSIYSDKGDELKKCSINANNITTIGSFASCDVDILIPSKKNYYICMKKSNSSGIYKTKISTLSGSSNYCGGYAYPGQKNDASYEMGAMEKKFGSVGIMNIKNELPNFKSISLMIKNYIENQYGSLDCSSNPCYVPIRMISSVNQNITINNVISKYISNAMYTQNKIYEIENKEPMLNGESNKIIINNIFKVGNKLGKRSYDIKINGDPAVPNKKINIKEVKFNLYPKIAISGILVKFNAELSINKSIKSYTWDFGDNSSKENSTVPYIKHSYKKIKEYVITIEAIDYDGIKISKSFNITIGSAKTLVISELSNMKSNLNTINRITLNLNDKEKKMLFEKVDIEGLMEKINRINSTLNENSTEEEYGIAFNNISILRVPVGLTISLPKLVPFNPIRENVDVDVIKNITNEIDVSGNNNEIKDAVLLWSKKDTNVIIKESEIVINWKDEDELLQKKFNIYISPGPVKEYYLIFDNNILYSYDDGIIKGTNGKSYIIIPGKIKNVDLFTKSDISILDLPIIVSPKISDLDLISPIKNEANKKINKPMRIAVGIIVAIFLGFLAYLGLKYWYKTKYERYLFKDKNSLYNVMLYVNKNITAGVSIDDIRESLKKSGWSSEQIRYILRKYKGKETGIPGIGDKSKKLKVPNLSENYNKNMFQDRKYKP